MNGWKRWLAFSLVLLLALTPLCGSQAAQDSFCLRLRPEIHADAALEALETLSDDSMDQETAATIKMLLIMLDAMELDVQISLGQTKQTRVAVRMSGQELFYIQEDLVDDMLYITSDLWPGSAMRVYQGNPQEAYWDFLRADITGLYLSLQAETNLWLSTLEQQQETGQFLGDVIPRADERVSYFLDDRDIATLVGAWIDTLFSRQDIMQLMAAWYPEGYWESWMAMVDAYNLYVGMENLYTYSASVLWEDGTPVGATVSGNSRESSERPWQLTMGWQDKDFDLLVTVPQGAEDLLVRYTLDTEARENETQMDQLFHVLRGGEGQSYAAAAVDAMDEVRMDSSTALSFTEMRQDTRTDGDILLRTDGNALRVPFWEESSLDLSTLSFAGVFDAFLEEEGRPLLRLSLEGELTEPAEIPNLEGLEFFEYDEVGIPAWEDAVNQGYEQLIVRIFKAIPGECFDLVTQWMLQP